MSELTTYKCGCGFEVSHPNCFISQDAYSDHLMMFHGPLFDIMIAERRANANLKFGSSSSGTITQDGWRRCKKCSQVEALAYYYRKKAAAV